MYNKPARRRLEVSFLSEAMRKLISPVTNSRFALTHSQHCTSPFSNRNKSSCFSRRLPRGSRLTYRASQRFPTRSSLTSETSKKRLRRHPLQHLILLLAMAGGNSSYDYIIVGAG